MIDFDVWLVRKLGEGSTVKRKEYVWPSVPNKAMDRTMTSLTRKLCVGTVQFLEFKTLLFAEEDSRFETLAPHPIIRLEHDERFICLFFVIILFHSRATRGE